MKKVLFLLIGILVGNCFNAQVMLVNDLFPGASSSTPDGIYLFNNQIYFTADNGVHGIEVWKHTIGGSTVLWDEVNSGAGSSTYPNFGKFNNKLYFSGYEDTYGNELYQYDTLNNLTRISDICVGCNSIPSGLIEFNSKLYFAANGPGNDFELYEYDGINPPVLTYNINPTSNSYPFEKIVYNSKMYFHADDGINGKELWVYDGVNPPTMVMDINPGSGASFPEHFLVYNSKLFFSADDGVNGIELWSYDGVNPPSMVIDMEAGGLSFNPKYLFEFNGLLVFSAYRNSPGNEIGHELFSYNGVNPPNLVMDINAGNSSSLPRYFVELNGVLYFRAEDATHGREIWAWDGVNSPYLAYDLKYGPMGSSPNWDLNARKNIVAINNTLYFAADTGSIGEEFYKVTPCLITPTVNQTGITLTATQSVISYQWIDCNNGNLPISGATNQSYTPSVNGSYAVVLNNGICNDTSACLIINSVGINSEENLKISIYPNPTIDIINIDTKEEIQKIFIYTTLGSLVQREVKTNFSVENLTSGIYLLHIETKNGTSIQRFVKE